MLSSEAMDKSDRRLSEAFLRERSRLRNFIRGRVANEADVEDVLQEVFSELVEAHALMEPVRQMSAWLFRVARNRMIDRFRKQGVATLRIEKTGDEEGQGTFLEDLLLSSAAGPEAEFSRGILAEELGAALDELPPEQRHVFVAHELDGISFRDLAKQTGLSVNTLLSRKHYAVLHLRERLQAIYQMYVKP